MFIFEFTDKKIIIYNQKKKELYDYIISDNIILNNKIYDYIKFVKTLNIIVNKYKIINTIFRIQIKVLLFEKISPTEEYLIKKGFQEIGNFNVRLIPVYRYFDGDFLIISGNNLYYKNKIIKKIPKGRFVLIGYSNNYNGIKTILKTKYKIELLEYENSNTIIYEKV